MPNRGLLDLRVIELLSSRLCHELISPISAVGNGLELLSGEAGNDADGGMVEEVSALVSRAAAEASAKLQFYRLAYGLGGDNTSPPPLAELCRLVTAVVGNSRTRVSWGNWPVSQTVDRSLAKLLLNVALLAQEALPRGGAVGVAPVEGGAVVTAQGQGAGLSAESRAALDGAVVSDAVTVRTVHAYFTGRLADAQGIRVGLEVGADNAAFTIAR